MEIWEVSAKTGSGVGQLFLSTVQELADAGKATEDV